MALHKCLFVPQIKALSLRTIWICLLAENWNLDFSSLSLYQWIPPQSPSRCTSPLATRCEEQKFINEMKSSHRHGYCTSKMPSGDGEELAVTFGGFCKYVFVGGTPCWRGLGERLCGASVHLFCGILTRCVMAFFFFPFFSSH